MPLETAGTAMLRRTTEVMHVRGSREGLIGTIVTALALVACQAGPGASPSATPAPTSAQPTPASTASPSADAWHLLALGDSDTTGSGDPTGKGWVEYYAQLIRAGQGHEVIVANLAQEGNTSSALATAVRSSQALRDAIATADIIVLGIGGADLNAGDDALATGTCASTACYDAPITGFATNVEAIAAEIVSIRAGEPTVLRAITVPNVLTGAEDVIPAFLTAIATTVGVYTAQGLGKATCDAMTSHGGACIDVLTAFNGPDGKADAYKAGLLNHVDCCYPNEKGQRLMADLLYATGLKPLVSP